MGIGVRTKQSDFTSYLKNHQPFWLSMLKVTNMWFRSLCSFSSSRSSGSLASASSKIWDNPRPRSPVDIVRDAMVRQVSERWNIYPRIPGAFEGNGEPKMLSQIKLVWFSNDASPDDTVPPLRKITYIRVSQVFFYIFRCNSPIMSIINLHRRRKAPMAQLRRISKALGIHSTHQSLLQMSVPTDQYFRRGPKTHFVCNKNSKKQDKSYLKTYEK